MKEYIVDGWNNFCRVFELPEKYPEGFCFGGGKAVNFQMVDWFNPVSELHQPAISKIAWVAKYGKIDTVKVTLESLSKELIPFLVDKLYVKKDKEYLVICNFGLTIIFKKD